jgi:hypothetical protein
MGDEADSPGCQVFTTSQPLDKRRCLLADAGGRSRRSLVNRDAPPYGPAADILEAWRASAEFYRKRLMQRVATASNSAIPTWRSISGTFRRSDAATGTVYLARSFSVSYSVHRSMFDALFMVRPLHRSTPILR